LKVDNSVYFDTIVVRGPNLSYGGSSPAITLRELQCWVNDTNILFKNSSTLNTFFASWLEIDVPITNDDAQASNIHNNE